MKMIRLMRSNKISGFSPSPGTPNLFSIFLLVKIRLYTEKHLPGLPVLLVKIRLYTEKHLHGLPVFGQVGSYRVTPN